MNKEVVYIAELDADVDDVIAAEYLHNKGVLKCVVLDPIPKTDIGRQRVLDLQEVGITVLKKMPPVVKFVFVGGALSVVSSYIINHHIEALVMNGGFVGNNIVNQNDQLDKFKGKRTIRTFNFNCDVTAADRVLRSNSNQIGKVILIGKNVCHSIKNTELGFWKDKEFADLFKKYHVKPGKRQHDMLACHEGLVLLGLINEKLFVDEYSNVKPYNTGLRGSNTEWGSTVVSDSSTPYRSVLAAIS